ncbi:YceI family protein, partial [Salmonella enterica]|nr:YceI family protein [Salmonella enterica]
MNIMKKSFLGAVLSLGLLSAAHADVYKFDNTHTNAVFNIDHFQTSTNHGGFYAISGELKYQPEKQVAEMRVTIPVSALNTGVDAFDNHIR